MSLSKSTASVDQDSLASLAEGLHQLDISAPDEEMRSQQSPPNIPSSLANDSDGYEGSLPSDDENTVYMKQLEKYQQSVLSYTSIEGVEEEKRMVNEYYEKIEEIKKKFAAPSTNRNMLYRIMELSSSFEKVLREIPYLGCGSNHEAALELLETYLKKWLLDVKEFRRYDTDVAMPRRTSGSFPSESQEKEVLGIIVTELVKRPEPEAESETDEETHEAYFN